MNLFLIPPVLVASILLVLIAAGMYACLEVGLREGRRHLNLAQAGARAGLGGIENALYALFGLLLAFSFGGAASRFDVRRNQAYDEAHAARTAWRRLDLLAEPGRTSMRELLRQHVSENVKAYEKVRGLQEFKDDMARLGELEDKIWVEYIAVTRQPGNQGATVPVIQSLTALFDLRAARTVAVEKHPPLLILAMLFFLGFVASFLTGFAMAEAKVRSVPHIVAYLGIVSVTIYVILDLEFPRLGLIRVDAADEAMRTLLRTMS